MTVKLGVLAVSTALLSLTLAAIAQAEVIASEQAPTPISVFGATALWSSYVPKSDSYRLRLYANGMGRTLPVRSRPVPFDADLGRDARGRTVAVYSRCRTESASGVAQGIPRSRDNARGCDIYELVLASGKERKIEAVSSSTASEFLPTIDGDRIAFARRYEHRSGTAGRIATLKLFNLKTRRGRNLPGGTRGSYANLGSKSEPILIGGPGPGALDLSGKRLAVGWEYINGSCPDDELDGLVQSSEIWLVTTAGEQTQLVAGICGNQPSAVSPTIASGRVMYLRTISPERLVLTDPGNGPAVESAGYEGALAVGGGARGTFQVRTAPSGEFEIVRSIPSFQRNG